LCRIGPVICKLHRGFLSRWLKELLKAIKVAASYLHEDFIQDHLEQQQLFYKRFYNWNKKGMEWESFLRGAISERK